MKSFNSAYIKGVDHLRAFAAVLVLFQHCYVRIGGRLEFGHGQELFGTVAATPLELLMAEGHTGVALFMVLSGFIFTHIAYDKKCHYGRFILNRILRIYPLMLAVFAAGALVRFSDVGKFDLLAVLAIPFQFKIERPIDLWAVPEHLYPFTTLFWTIAPEFKFYILFPLLLALLHRNGPVVLAALLVGAVILRLLLVAQWGDVHNLSYFTIFGRIDQFLIGMVAAVAYRSLPARGVIYLCPLAGLVVLLLLFGYNRAGSLPVQANWKVLWPTAEGSAWAAFIIGYLRLAPRLPVMLSKVLVSVGEVSFSMYLLHVAVIAVVLRLGPPSFGLGPTGASFLNCLLFVLPGTIAVSWITFRLIERPFLSLRVRYLTGPGTSSASSASRLPATESKADLA